MKKDLIVPAGTPTDDAVALAIANGCVGFYQGVPPVMQDLASSRGWTLPCTVDEDDDGNVIGWDPVN